MTPLKQFYEILRGIELPHEAATKIIDAAGNLANASFAIGFEKASAIFCNKNTDVYEWTFHKYQDPTGFIDLRKELTNEELNDLSMEIAESIKERPRLDGE